MKNFIKAVALVLVVAVFGVGFAGCGAKKANGKIKIGVFQYMKHEILDNASKGILQGLKDAGYNESNSVIDLQVGTGDSATAGLVVSKFVSNKYDIVIAFGTQAAQAAFAELNGTNIPLVINSVTAPVEAGLTDSLEKPNKNVTGSMDLVTGEDLLKVKDKVVPTSKKVGICYNSGDVSSSKMAEDVKAKAGKYGVSVETITVSATADVALAMDTLLNRGIDSLITTFDPIIASSYDLVIDKTASKNVPVIAPFAEQVEQGALAGVGFDYFVLGQDAGPVVKKILNGTPVSDIPIEVSKNYDIYVNKAVAGKFGIDLSKLGDVKVVE